MAATTLPALLDTGDHASRPAASAVGTGALYSCTDHSLVYQTDGSTWTTWATLGGGGIQQTLLDAKGDLVVASAADTAARLAVGTGNGSALVVASGETTGLAWLKHNHAATAAPVAGDDNLDGYAVGSIWIDTTNDAAYICVDASTGAAVWNPFEAAGGASDPLLYVDDIALHADGDNFTSTGLTGWTKVGSGSVTAITTEPYDATCLDIQFSAQSDRIYKAIDAGDWTYYLTLHGVTNATPSSSVALNAMLALTATDDAGNGTGMSLYDDDKGYLWQVAGNAYSGTGNIILTPWTSVAPAAASSWPIVYRLAKSGTTITAGISFNGGASWKTNTRTDSTTFTRIGITRLYTGGGTNPTLRVGRFNLVP